MQNIGSPRYELGRCLGTGATGVVYEAFDRHRRVSVALKTLRKVEPTALRRLKQEFRALSDIAHPNLVSLHELVASDGACFLTMDLVEGVPFLEWVRGATPARRVTVDPTFEWIATPPPPGDDAPPHPLRGTAPPDPERLREAFRQLAEGVAALHQHGRLHRDLKPSNVLVDRDGHVTLLDFGLVAALQLDGSPGRGPVVGTVAYMSPEQAGAELLTAASDWYAVGTMLFEALTGERPFSGPLHRVLSDKQHLDPPDPREICDGLPEDLAVLCRELVSRRPTDRPSGPEIVRRFGGVVTDVPTGGLVGRAEELDQLLGAWERAREGHAVLATVRGRSGIGKTALVDRFLATMSSPVLAGRCYERESVPYKALDGLVDALSERLGPDPPRMPDVEAVGELFPVLRRPSDARSTTVADPHERRSRGFRGLERMITSLAPLVVHVDDAHWGDADSAAFFAELLTLSAPILVLLTWRTEEQEQSVFLRALSRAGTATVAIELDQLPPADCEALARRLLPNAGDDTIESIAKASGGHPLFVHELARAGAERALAIDLDDAIRARVARLPPVARDLLEASVISGRPMLDRILASAAGSLDVATSLAVLRVGRLVRTSGPRVEPFHDRVREAVTDGMSPARKRTVHEHLARALIDAGDPDPEPLAVHLIGAGEAERALPYAVEAAERANRALAFDHAARLYAVAVAGARDPQVRRDLSIRLGAALAAAARPAEAAETWLALPDLPVELQCLAAEQLLAAGHVRRGLETLEAAARQVGLSVPLRPAFMLADVVARGLLRKILGLRWEPRTVAADDPVRERLAVCWAAVDGLTFIDPLRMAAYQARFLPLALRSGDPGAVARALLTEAGAVSFVGGPAAWIEAQRLLDEAGRAVAASDDPALPALHRYGAAMLAYHQHRFDEAYHVARECEALVLERSAHSASQVVRTRMLQCWCHIWRGRLREIAEVVPRLVKDAEERGNLYLATSAVTDIGYILGMVRDDPEPVHQALAEREQWWTGSGFHLQHLNLGMSRIQLAQYAGDAALAWTLADALYQQWNRSILRRGMMFKGLVHQLRARAALGLAEVDPVRRPELLRVARTTLALLARLEVPQGSAAVAGLEGRILEIEGDAPRAVARLREAVVGLDGSGIAALAQAYRRHLGLVIGGDEGRGLVARADDWMRDQGVVRPERFAAAMLMSERGR